MTTKTECPQCREGRPHTCDWKPSDIAAVAAGRGGDGINRAWSPTAPGPALTVEEIIKIIDHCRASGVRSFVYRDLQLSFEGTKSGDAREALRNPALRQLLDGVPR